MRYIDIPVWIKPLAAAFRESGFDLYLVGGYVRNQLLSLPYSDIDICSAAIPQQAILLAKSAGFIVKERNVQLGTMDIYSGDNSLEYTPFRLESYTKGTHRPDKVIFTDDISQDASRRDFRCNAIYADAFTGQVVDPLGGVDDACDGLLRACRDNPEDTIRDDGLRLMRLARFAAQLGFRIQPELFCAACRCANNIDDISGERIAGEMRLICLADIKYNRKWRGMAGHYRAMRILDGMGVLGRIYPELMEGKALKQHTVYHAYDVFNHNMHSYEVSKPRLDLRISALFHDVAKPRQAALNNGKMYGHDKVGAEMAREMLARTGFGNAFICKVCTLIERHMFDLDGKAKVSTCRKRFARWGFDFVRDLIDLRTADIGGSGRAPSDENTPQKWTEILEAMIAEGAIDDFSQLDISGEDIMKVTGLRPGKDIGRIKDHLFDRVALKPSLNTRGILLNEAYRFYESM